MQSHTICMSIKMFNSTFSGIIREIRRKICAYFLFYPHFDFICVHFISGVRLYFGVQSNDNGSIYWKNGFLRVTFVINFGRNEQKNYIERERNKRRKIVYSIDSMQTDYNDNDETLLALWIKFSIFLAEKNLIFALFSPWISRFSFSMGFLFLFFGLLIQVEMVQLHFTLALST